MPSLIPHFLLPSLLVALWRDRKLKKIEKRQFPLHYVFLAGLGGVLPDVDVLFYIVLSLAGKTYYQVHRVFTHSLLFPLLFVLLGFILYKIKIKFLGKHHINLGIACFVIAFGILTHILLDLLLQGGNILLLYPFTHQGYGWDVIGTLPWPFNDFILAIVDAILLFVWIGYLEFKHKLSDFI